MKKLALFTVMAAIALQGLGADPSMSPSTTTSPVPTLPLGYTSVHFNLNVVQQGATTTNNDSLTSHFANVNIADDDIFGLVNNEFGTSFSVTNGDQLVTSNIWDGKFSVLNGAGDVVLANASSNTNGDDYHLYFQTIQSVQSGTETATNANLFSATDTRLSYESGNGTNTFHVEGYTSVYDQYTSDPTNNSESFQLYGGIGSLSFGDNGTNGIGTNGVISGSIFGSGKGNAPPP